jgi:hypothetical protein
MVLLAIDLHLVRLGMISIMPPARHQGPWHHHHGRPSPLQYISWIYIQHAGLKKEKPQPYGSCRLFTINLISYNNFVTMTISHHMPCKNKLDASKLSLQILRGFGLPRKEPILPTDKNHNVDTLVVSFRPFPGPSVANAISLMLEKQTPPKPLYTVQAVCQA